MPSIKRTTIKDVAADAQVSIKTVSNVLNGSGSMREDTRKRVLDSMEKLGYVVNVSARSLKTGSTGLIGLAIFGFSQPFASDFADAVIDAARQVGYGVIISTYGYESSGFPAVIGETHKLGADGWVYFADRPLEREGTDLCQGYPVVLVGDYSSFGVTDSVTMPNVEAVYAATSRLLEAGLKHIALLGVPAAAVGMSNEALEMLSDGTRNLRLKGYARAFRDHGYSVDWDLVVPVEGMARKDGVMGAEHLMSVMGGVPDAVICMDDAMAFGAMYAFQHRGFKIPQDVQVVGFDNVSEGEYSTPSLTTINPFIKEYAKKAVSMLVERIGGYRGEIRNYVTDYELVERESTSLNI